MADPTPLDAERRQRLEQILRHLLGLVSSGYWGSVQYQLRAGLIVGIREERTLDPAAPTGHPAGR